MSAAKAAVLPAGATVAPRIEPALERRRAWERRYARQLRISDVLAVLLVTVGVALVDSLVTYGGLAAMWTHGALPILSGALWITMLALFRTRSSTIVGSGSTEYVRLAHSTGFAFGIVAMIFVIFQLPGARTQLIFALPIGLLVLLVNRWAWRRWLNAKRKVGLFTSRAIVTGSRDDIEYVIRRLERDGKLGYSVVGIATTDTVEADMDVDGKNYPRVGSTHSVAANARQLSADTIIVASRPDDDPDFIKRLSWQLEGTAAELILSSRLADVAGPRISLDSSPASSVLSRWRASLWPQLSLPCPRRRPAYSPTTWNPPSMWTPTAGRSNSACASARRSRATWWPCSTTRASGHSASRRRPSGPETAM
ncbi:hypothetical protein [Microbacterium pumilum]|uniref:Sugar transferase n=1 Tax=Microbacterium pumilum TaxID=344165 RepID=A0ABN2S1I7_9MICO